MKNMAEKVINSLKYRLFHFHFWKRVNDEIYLKIRYRVLTGKSLNLDDPKTFNEKLNWLKLHDRKPEYTTMVDKYAAKEYVANLIGDEYVIPTIGVWDRFEEIDFDKLPNQFVLKCTHDSGGLVICKDKKALEKEVAKAKIEKSMGRNFYWICREWPYKNVKPRIVAEKYMQDGDDPILRVYKVFNFNGIPRIIQTIQNDKSPNESIDYFDTEWNLLDLRQNYPNSQVPTSKPQNLATMLELSAKCSAGVPFLRTDWYEINGKVFFSEFTFYSDAGMEPFHPEKWDEILGSWIDLPDSK